MSWRTLLSCGAVLSLAACSDPGSPVQTVDNFRITFVGQNELGTPDNPRPFSADRSSPDSFTIDVEAMRNGQIDATYNGWVVLDVRPGTVSCGQVNAPDPPAVKLENGVARNVSVELVRAYCTVRLVAVDEGYVQAADPSASACNNGKDDDGDGYIDYPGSNTDDSPINYGDRGCAMPGDDSEEGGSGAAGSSPPIYFRCPLIKDIQTPVLGKTGNESPLKSCRAMVDRGWLLVTRVGVDGLYLTDFEGVKWDETAQNWSFPAEELAYDSMFVYNYSTPLNLQEGDCLTQVDGTVDEFYGFTELNKPTWKKGDFAFCAAKARAAGLNICPQTNGEAESESGRLCRQRVEQLANSPVDLTKLIMKDAQGIDRSVWDQAHIMTEPFESGIVKVAGVDMFTEARACDADSDGLIDFGNDQEKECSNDCGDDKSCMVLENYNRYNQWTVHFEDGEGATREVSVVTAGSIQDFDPVKASKAAGATPKKLPEVVGTLRHLIFGRPPWTIETRRPSDCPGCVN